MSKDDIEGLVDLITWYRDEYHHSDFGHAAFIKELLNKNLSKKRFEQIEAIVDGWID